MKLAFLVGTAILAFSVASTAAPESPPALPSQGTAVFEGHVFQYRIHDRGVRTSGQIFPKPAIITSERNYVLAYTTKDDLSRDQMIALADAIRSDGAEKCKELSDSEFATFQKSDSPDAIKKSAGQIAEFNGYSSLELRLNSSLLPGLFTCNAIIKVQVN